jgi:hypothetical protein
MVIGSIVLRLFSFVCIGWQDGSIRCTDSAGRVKWFLPTAHRDGTNTISHHVSYN